MAACLHDLISYLLTHNESPTITRTGGELSNDNKKVTRSY